MAGAGTGIGQGTAIRLAEEGCKVVVGDIDKAYLPITASPRVGESEDIAAMVALLFSGDGAWVNGQILAVDGGVTMRR